MAGEIAEMMLDGTMCSCCGAFLNSDSGYPMMCSGCAREERRADRSHKHETREEIEARKPHKCPACKKRFRKPIGLHDHLKFMHAPKAT